MDAQKFNELLRRIGNNDETALEEIYEVFCNKMLIVARCFCGDLFYAYDIINEVLITIWNKSYKMRKIEKPEAYIYTLTKNISITFYRKYIKPHRNNISIDLIPNRFLETFDNYKIEFYELLDGLDDITQEIVMMKVLYKFTFKEIAKELKMPQGTVSWRYWNALKNTRTKLDEKKN